jgi:hypothetical protein
MFDTTQRCTLLTGLVISPERVSVTVPGDWRCESTVSFATPVQSRLSLRSLAFSGASAIRADQ